jgi:hypothetical protein
MIIRRERRKEGRKEKEPAQCIHHIGAQGLQKSLDLSFCVVAFHLV